MYRDINSDWSWQSPNVQASVFLGVAVLIVLILSRRRRWKPSGRSHGTAAWMLEREMRARGCFGKIGIIVGRTFKGALIRIPDYVHVLLVGGTGSGKGVSVIIPNLLSYFLGSIVCFDTKGDLYKTTARRRAEKGEHVIWLSPFRGGKDGFNPLDAIRPDDPMLVDKARSLSEAVVARQGTEPDPYWNDKSAQVICAVLVFVLLRFTGEDRTLISVQEIISDPDLLKVVSDKLQELGGVPARLGSQLKALFANEEK